jgi:hypothetical protein
MRYAMTIALALGMGCRSGTLESGEWGKLRYFGELEGVVPIYETDDDGLEELVVLPPASDRDGNVYVLHERPTKESVVYVGNPYGGWSSGCYPNDLPLENADADDPALHGFLGTAHDMAWYWSGDALVQVSGTTGECRQVLDKDPLSLSDLTFVAAVPHIHETPARRTINAWVQSTEDAKNRRAPSQVVIDLDLRRYVTYSSFEPSDATCLEVLGVGANADRDEGVVVVAYNNGSNRVQQARFMDTSGNTTQIVNLDMGISTYFACDGVGPDDPSIETSEERPEPLVIGQLQSNDQGIYAGLLTNGDLLSFASNGGGTRDLPDFSVEGMARVDGDLWVTGVVNNEPVAGQVRGVGSVNEVVRWESSKRAASNLKGLIDVLDERYSPAEPTRWDSPNTAMGSFPLMSPYPLDEYALDTTGWLIAGPSFVSGGIARTAIAFGPVGMTVP